MPLYNVRMKIRRDPGGNALSFLYAPAQSAGPVFIGASLTRPFVRGNLANLGYLILRAVDRNQVTVLSRLTRDFRGALRVVFTKVGIPEQWAQVEFSVTNVILYSDALREFVASEASQFRISGLRVSQFNPANDGDVYIMVDRVQPITVTYSTAFTGADQALATGLAATLVAIEPVTGVGAGFEFDTWGRFVSVTSAIDFLALSGPTTFEETSTRVLDCRFDERIATGQYAVIEEEIWRISEVVEVMSKRTLRLTLEKVIT